jgi:cell division protein FtsZ
LKKRAPKLFVFSPEDLDDDDLILAVENTPAAYRTRSQLENLNSHIYTA